MLILPQLILVYYTTLRSMMMYARRHRIVKFLVAFVVLLVLFKICLPNYFSYTISYFEIIINLVNSDIKRHQDVIRQEAEVRMNNS
jgi:hypothetical protein